VVPIETRARESRSDVELRLFVRAHGSVRAVTDHEWKLRQVISLTGAMEQDRSDPWPVEDAPDSFIQKMVDSITDLVVSIDRIEGKGKVSQDRSDSD
jgi:transcriptional regulator